MSIPCFSGGYVNSIPRQKPRSSTVDELNKCLDAVSTSKSGELLYVREDGKGNITFQTAKKGFFSDWSKKSWLRNQGYSCARRDVADKVDQFVSKFGIKTHIQLSTSLSKFAARLGNGLFSLYARTKITEISKKLLSNQQSSQGSSSVGSGFASSRNQPNPIQIAKKNARNEARLSYFRSSEEFSSAEKGTIAASDNPQQTVDEIRRERRGKTIDALLGIVESFRGDGVDFEKDIESQLRIRKQIRGSVDDLKMNISKKIYDHVLLKLKIQIDLNFEKDIPDLKKIRENIRSQFIEHYSQKISKFSTSLNKDVRINDAKTLVTGLVNDSEDNNGLIGMLSNIMPSLNDEMSKSPNFDGEKINRDRSFSEGDAFQQSSRSIPPSHIQPIITSDDLDEEKKDDYSPASSTASSRSSSPTDTSSIASISPRPQYTVKDYKELFTLLAEKREQAAQRSWTSWGRKAKPKPAFSEELETQLTNKLLNVEDCKKIVKEAVSKLGTRQLSEKDYSKVIEEWKVSLKNSRSSDSGSSRLQGLARSTVVDTYFL